MAALGLLLLAAAVVVAIVGVATNTGTGHGLGHTVNLLGYHLQGSTGKLLLVGIIVGAVGMLGLNMLLAGVGRGMKRSVHNRRERKQMRRQTETATLERDQMAGELEKEQAARVKAERATAEQARVAEASKKDAAQKSRGKTLVAERPVAEPPVAGAPPAATRQEVAPGTYPEAESMMKPKDEGFRQGL